ncbi:ArsR/SmtB family transcription factor [Neotabrizicola shimadae]|uniref:Helix-turn-helix transcriptional regulator n=1 Tax=Neotabrizicola shimadae TaxID=2807096 RepID=A0A8G0ZW50_9RHOB|nr:helix-turn-helix domain-containing protein [Neotabrizicola shimadae]QYZ71283.1 helix-turn-helix transcriptional regulator [Neotabrizicola shimadae]
MQKGQALSALSALANDQRLDLLRLLMPRGEEGLPAGEIARSLGLSASRLSFHLAQMEQAGLIRSRKVARNVFYSVDAEGIGRTIGYLLNDCCFGNAKVRACCADEASVPLSERDQAAAQTTEITASAPER